MIPTLHPGDAVLTVSASHYYVGEVVAYRNDAEHRVILHRIVWTDGNRFELKGDHNAVPDPEVVRKSALIGNKVAVVPAFRSGLAVPLAALFILIVLWHRSLWAALQEIPWAARRVCHRRSHGRHLSG
jgi:signal peptidase I